MKIRRLFNIIIREIPVYYIARMFSIFPNQGIVCSLRGFLISVFLGECGKNFQLAQSSIINFPEKIKIGNNVYFAHRIYVNASKGLSVGDNVTIGPNCIIATENHSIRDGKVTNGGSGGNINIKDSTWIGGNVTITGGVTIGRGCIIGAGSVVTKDIPNNVLAAGTPARVIKKV